MLGRRARGEREEGMRVSERGNKGRRAGAGRPQQGSRTTNGFQAHTTNGTRARGRWEPGQKAPTPRGGVRRRPLSSSRNFRASNVGPFRASNVGPSSSFRASNPPRVASPPGRGVGSSRGALLSRRAPSDVSRQVQRSDDLSRHLTYPVKYSVVTTVRRSDINEPLKSARHRRHQIEVASATTS